MKFLEAFLLVTVASAQISQQRQSSLDALTKLRETLPDFIATRGSIAQHVSEAKQNASEVLNSFLVNVFQIKTSSLQSILKLEANTLAYGARFDSWCWENNIPMLEGTMGWAGTGYSECIKRLDKSVAQIIAKVYADFYKDETVINYNHSLFEAFEKRNIINNPQSIVDAISKTVVDLSNAIPEYESVIAVFDRYLNGTLPAYSECLGQRRNHLVKQIQLLKKETLRCVEEMRDVTGLESVLYNGNAQANPQANTEQKHNLGDNQNEE